MENIKLPVARMTNLTHSDVLPFLPLPSLPVTFGGHLYNLTLGEGQGSHGSEAAAAVLAQSLDQSTVDLLSGTDVSYLSLKPHSLEWRPATASERRAAMLEQNPKIFESTPLPGGWKPGQGVLPQQAKPLTTGGGLDGGGGGGKEEASGGWLRPDPWSNRSIEDEPIMRPRTKKRRTMRKAALDFPGEEAKAQDYESDLLNMIDKFLHPEDATNDRLGRCLTMEQLQRLLEVVLLLQAEKRLQTVSVEHLLKLVNLLDHHVRLGCVDLSGTKDVLSGEFEGVLLAMEAAQAVLAILTTPSMPSQLYVEEVIDGLLYFVKFHSTCNAFPVLDHTYKGPAVLDKVAAGDRADLGGDDSKETNMPKERAGGNTKVPFTGSAKAAAQILDKLCAIYELMSKLLALHRLQDSSILQLAKLALTAFTVENVHLLQLKAIGILCSICHAYTEHRIFIIEEVISLLWRVPATKRNLRSFHIHGDEGHQIQMVSALLLQLVQSSTVLPRTSLYSDEAERAQACALVYEPATSLATHFWRSIVSKWTTFKGQEAGDMRAIMDNLVADLLTCLNAPEFPGAGLLLQVFCSVLLTNLGIQSKDPTVHGMAIDHLGAVAVQLKADQLLYEKDRPWLLYEPANEGAEILLKKEEGGILICDICEEPLNGRALNCTTCSRLFHSRCVGEPQQEGRTLLCHLCDCKQQLLDLGVDVSAMGGPDSSDGSEQDEQVVLVQQTLLDFLAQAAKVDSGVALAREFYMCQWFQDASQDQLPKYEARLDYEPSLSRSSGSLPPLGRPVFVQIARALGQSRPLARGLPAILNALLSSLQDGTPTIRAKGLRALGSVVAVDPDLLGDDQVKEAVEGRFLDTSISVREAAMELVGKYIIGRPKLARKYYEHLADRIMDLGVSVRKRVIRIIREVYIEKAAPAERVNSCERLVSRVDDEEASIQDLVLKTFHSLLFGPLPDDRGPSPEARHAVPSTAASLSDRVALLVALLQKAANQQPIVSIIKRCLTQDTSVDLGAKTYTVDTEVRKVCEAMCRHLLESILQAEEAATSDTKALPQVLLLNAFCDVDPALCAPTSDPLRTLVTLQPYLQTQASKRDEAQLAQALLEIITAVLPLARPPSLLVDQLDDKLRQLIVRHPYLNVVHAAARCLGALSGVADKGLAGLKYLTSNYFEFLKKLRDSGAETNNGPNTTRALYALGVLCRYGAHIVDDTNPTLNFDTILEVYRHYMALPSFDVRQRALQGLGYLFTARPKLMMRGNIDKILQATLSAKTDQRLKIQTLRNFHDLLIYVEDDMKAAECRPKVDSRPSSAHKEGQDDAVPTTAGGADKLDAGVASGIVQAHWDRILERSVDAVAEVRHAALKVVEVSLRQGLVHPMTAVPHLVALEVDAQASTAKLAHQLLVTMYEKHPDFVESRLGDGVQQSFRFWQSVGADAQQLVAGGGIAKVYRLCRGLKGARNKFVQSITRKFDSCTEDIAFLVYCARALAALPFVNQDEPLYAVHVANRAIQLKGGALLASLKATLTGEGPFGAAVRARVAAVEREAEEAAVSVYSDVEAPLATGLPGTADTLEGLPVEETQRIKADLNQAMALSLLLLLKRYLKMAYALSDERCQAYSPTDAAKSFEQAFRRDAVGVFDPALIPTAPPDSVKAMWERYQRFKQLMKEDTIDYGVITVSTSRKRGSMQRGVTAPEAGGLEAPLGDAAQEPASGNKNEKRRAKSLGQAKRKKRQGDPDEEDEDDEDWALPKISRAKGFSRARGKRREPDMRTSL